MAQQRHLTASEKIIAATFGGTCVSFIVTPFDVVKARLQAEKKNKFTGPLDLLKNIVRNEGVKALWRGLKPTLMMQLPASALYFPTYEFIKETVDKTQPKERFWLGPALAGISARMLTVTVISPLELIRTNLQANVKSDVTIESNSMYRSLVNITQRHGWTQLWGGLIPTLWRDVPFSASYWAGYEYCVRLIDKRFKEKFKDSSKGYPIIRDFIAGATSGTFACVISNPMDVVKTRRQMSLSPEGKGAEAISMIVRTIVKEDGYYGFLRGMIPRTAKVAPGCAIMIASYEFCKRSLASDVFSHKVDTLE